MKKNRFLLSFVLPLSLFAQGEECLSFKESANVESGESLQIATMSGMEEGPEIQEGPPLVGIVFLGDWNEARRELADPVQGVQIRGVRLLQNSPRFIREISADFMGSPLNENTIAKLKCKLASFYNQEHQPFVIVSVPRQNLEKGMIQVVVEEAKLGEIRVRGNKHYSPTQIMKPIRVKSGETILTQEVVEDLAWMNQNPFRRTDLVFVPGSKPGTADIELATIDRWPYRIYAGADNTGTIASMRDRIFFGFDFGKTLVPDGQIAYQFTFSPNWNRFIAHTAEARIPCPWRHLCILYGGYSQTQPEREPGVTFDRGKSWQVDGRYRIPFLGNSGVLQTLVIGYDFKEVQSRIRYTDASPFHAVADINQFMLGYELGAKGRKWKTSFVAEIYGNPGSFTSRNFNDDYQQFRFDAQARYLYLKVAHSFAGKIWHFPVSYDLTGQVSSTNLLPSEQFTLTGYNAVRGFEERIVNVDRGAVLNVSIETPHFSPSKLLGTSRTDEFYFLGFFDCGLGSNHSIAVGEPNWTWLASVGPGVRYQYSRYITARFDYGFQLGHRGFDDPTHSRYNFGAIISY